MNLGSAQEESYDLCIGDLMAGLLLIFVLFLAATLLRLEREYEEKRRLMELTREQAQKREKAAEAVELIAKTYDHLQRELYDDLLEEFRADLPRWGAEIDRLTLSIRFEEPEVLFDKGKARLRSKFCEVLADFFPRYVRLLYREKYRGSVEEIRIEGHTSSEWSSRRPMTKIEKYLKNMALSQDRTRTVLEYCLEQLESLDAVRDWARFRITANGLSSSKLVIVNGQEDKKASRRVEFRVRMNSEDRIREILKLRGPEVGR